MGRFNPIVVLIVILTAALARGAEPTYVIHFDEADHKGDRATFERVSATIIQNSTRFDDQDEARESETTIGMRLRGEGEVLDADAAAANSTAESITVRSWTRKVEENGKVVSVRAKDVSGTKEPSAAGSITRWTRRCGRRRASVGSRAVTPQRARLRLRSRS